MPVMRLSYYGGGHYDSIVSPWHADQITHRKPGELEDFTIARSKERSRSRTATAAALGEKKLPSKYLAHYKFVPYCGFQEAEYQH